MVQSKHFAGDEIEVSVNISNANENGLLPVRSSSTVDCDQLFPGVKSEFFKFNKRKNGLKKTTLFYILSTI